VKAQHKDQLQLPPMPLRNTEPGTPAFRSSEDATAAFHQAEGDGYAIAALLFDQALRDPRCPMTNQEVAYLLKVSESLVQKWRSPGARACPSFAQMLKLPTSFHVALHRAMNRHFGFGRAALRDLLEAAGSLAVVVE
jgi:hypothetical protein